MIELNGRYYMLHDFEHELWQTLPDFPDYMISNFSRVKRMTPNNNHSRIMKPQIYDNKTKESRCVFMLVNRDGKQMQVRIEDLYSTVKFKHIISIAEQSDEYVKYQRWAEYIYNAF